MLALQLTPAHSPLPPTPSLQLFEQLGQLCEKSDVYALGVIMVQLVRGEAGAGTLACKSMR